MTAPAGITTPAFAGILVPPDVQAQVINLLVSGAPFANSLTRVPTNRSTVGWPTAKPTGWAWLGELAPFPTIGMGDDAYIAAVAKIGGIVDLSNEMVTDSAINMMQALGGLLQDSLSRDLDLGLLEGSGPPEPVGVIGVAPEATGADLLTAVAAAKGAIGDAGGNPTTLAASATALATIDTSTNANGDLLYPGGFAAAVGLTPVSVPGLDTPLVYDRGRVFLVVRNDATVEMSKDFHFNLDASSIRVKARIAAAIPDPNKAIRKLTIAPGALTVKATAATTTKATK